MEYLKEHTWVGQVGHFLILLAFVSALFSAFSFFNAGRTKEVSWKKVARVGYLVHFFSIIGVVLLFAFMIVNHYYEYNYVWKYSSNAMQLKYIFSCFWAGQEGSFLTWIFWQVVVGVLLMYTAKKWENPVMTVFGIIQALLLTMIFGVYFGDYHLGASPFALIRELPENIGLPWTQMEDYIDKVPMLADGQGLNPLLQNYWMTIHPPTTFLGFALTSVPFAFALAALWNKDFYSWVKPALPWAFTGIIVLGIAILMGGAWAYESLNFGGFWAWDPVENAILIPWLTFVGAGHVMLIIKNRKRSVYTGLFLSLITFILIVYSTFLTRSGVLGDSSVHSFTGEGMLGQLLFFLVLIIFISVFSLLQSKKYRLQYGLIAFFLFIFQFFIESSVEITIVSFLVSIGYLIVDYFKFFPKEKEEDAFLSREFWMFIGALILALESIHLAFDTSIPVVNLIFGTDWDPLTEMKERNAHYNPIHALYALFIVITIAVSQYLKYKKSEPKKVFKYLRLPLISAAIITIIISVGFSYEMKDIIFVGLIFATLFAVGTNLSYFIMVFKGSIKKSGASIAHIGLALVLLGAVITTSNQTPISLNSSGTNLKALSSDFDNNSNIQIFKGDTLKMGDYYVAFEDKYLDGIHMRFKINYFDFNQRIYQKGDRILRGSQLYESNENHKASTFFSQDIDKWTLIDNPSTFETSSVRQWKNGVVGDSLFTLSPFIQLNEKFGYVSEPGTKHYWDKDVFTFLKYFDQGVMISGDTIDDGYMEPRSFFIGVDDTVAFSHFLIITDGWTELSKEERIEKSLGENDLVFKLSMRVIDLKDNQTLMERVEPLFILRDRQLFVPDVVHVDAFNINLAINKPDENTKERKLSVSIQEPEYIVMEAIVFPYINILWLGCLIMAIGTVIAVIERVRVNRKTKD